MRGLFDRRFAQKKDLWIILLLLLLSIGGLGIFRLAGNAQAASAQVILEGRVVQTVSLARDRTFSIPQCPQVLLEVRDGRCAFVRSDCPDQVCVHTGFLGTPGQYAACLPNQMVLKIIGDAGEESLDMVAY